MKTINQAVAVFAFHPDKRHVLASVRLSPGRFVGLWQVAGGSVEGGESRIEAAARELHEETGIRCGILSMYHVGSFQEHNEHGRYTCTAYMTVLASGEIPPNPEPDENSGWEWRDIRELDNLMPGTLDMYQLALNRITGQ